MDALPAGPDAVLLDFADESNPSTLVRRAASAMRAAVDAGALARVAEVIPAATTLLVQFAIGSGADVLGVHRALREGAADDAEAAEAPVVEIGVHYDGADLAEVAATLGVDGAQVVAWHTGTTWRVEFMGFAPGFGYLVPESDCPLTTVGRRAEPRTRVPAGAVAVAAGYSAVYPRSSPGGWHLVGRTDRRLWDESSTPPTPLGPGTRVRFRDLAGTP
ncbi:MAG: carboxyltransferase domain-containing protein [Gordonia sp. (in: high G+C Gram-positive bacteria)]